MKIAYICTEKLPSPSVKGGAIQMMIDGVSPFLSINHELTVFSITDPSLPNEETREGVHYLRFDRENYRYDVANELKNHEFDLIHVFNRPKNVVLYKNASPNSEIVLSLHNDMFLKHKITDEEGKEAVANATAITTVSNYIKQRLVGRFPEAEPKISIAYSGVDLKPYPPIWSEEGKQVREIYRRRFELENKKVILFVGRLSKTKGPHILIQAMKDIVRVHKDAVLVIVGGKWFSDNRLNKYVRYLHYLAKPLQNHVIFTKYIPADEIPNIFLMGDVFVCSSQWNEPLARVHYEAMAAGIPLISTNRGGNGEVIKDEFNGLIIDNFDQPKAFVKAIHKIIGEPELANWMAKNGRRFIELNFTFRHATERLERVYINTVSNKTTTHSTEKESPGDDEAVQVNTEKQDQYTLRYKNRKSS